MRWAYLLTVWCFSWSSDRDAGAFFPQKSFLRQFRVFIGGVPDMLSGLEICKVRILGSPLPSAGFRDGLLKDVELRLGVEVVERRHCRVSLPCVSPCEGSTRGGGRVQGVLLSLHHTGLRRSCVAFFFTISTSSRPRRVSSVRAAVRFPEKTRKRWG